MPAFNTNVQNYEIKYLNLELINSNINFLLLLNYEKWSTGCTGGTRFPAGATDFFVFHSVQTILRPIQPPIQWVQEDLSLAVKAAGS
jgi:hypothetical protein